MEVEMRRNEVKSRKKKKSKGFNPNRDYLNDAVKDYLEKGGKITKIIDVSDEAERFDGSRDFTIPADDFLLGH